MSEMKKWAVLSSATLAALSGSYASAAATVYGAPGYTTASGGYRGSTSSIPGNPGQSVASAGSNGLTIANEVYYPGATNAGANTSPLPIVINPLASGGYTFLGAVAGQTTGYTAVALNPGATLIAGTATVQTSPATSTGAVVWKPDGTAPYVLPLPTYASGVPSTAAANATARAINDAGTVVGGGNFYTSAGIQSSSSGFAYYNGGTSSAPSYTAAAVQLLPLGLSSASTTNNQSATANGISAGGVAAGQSSLSPSNFVATFWNVGNAATGATTIAGNQLSIAAPSGFSTLKADNATGANSGVTAISSTAIAGGTATFYPTGSSTGTLQPIRWTPAVSGVLTTSTPGQVLSLPAGYTSGGVNALNAGGDAVGTVSGGTINSVAVSSAELWKAGSATPIALKPVAAPLVNPGTGTTMIPAVASYNVRSINDNGVSVGYALNSVNATTPIDAVLWDASGSVTELNTLTTLVAAGGAQAGWVTLVGAYAITNDNWVSGLGVYYDPNVVAYTTTGNPAPQNTYGAGTYYRAFEIQVPEPASLAAISLIACAFGRRRRIVRSV